MVTSPELDRTPSCGEAAAAAGHLARICFKTGPPTLTGVELEWTVHDAADPARPVDRDAAAAALGRHSPATLDDTSPAEPLRHGSPVTVEPGGQVEISTPPRPSVAALIQATEADIAELTDLLGRAGLVLGRTGIDPHRGPRPVRRHPRYRAMRGAFDRRGPAGRTMMYSTAGLQVCLDAGEPDQAGGRWAAVHAVGPPLLAAFATAGRHAGPAHRLGVRPDGRLAGHRPGPHPAGLVAGRRRRGPGRRLDPVRAGRAAALPAPATARTGPRRRASPSPTGSTARCPDRPPPTTSTTTSAPSSRRCARAATWRCATSTPSPAADWSAPAGGAGRAARRRRHRPTRPGRVAAPVADRWRAAARHGLADPPLAARRGGAARPGPARRCPGTDLPAEHPRRDRPQAIRRRLAAAERATPVTHDRATGHGDRSGCATGSPPNWRGPAPAPRC